MTFLASLQGSFQPQTLCLRLFVVHPANTPALLGLFPEIKKTVSNWQGELPGWPTNMSCDHFRALERHRRVCSLAKRLLAPKPKPGNSSGPAAASIQRPFLIPWLIESTSRRTRNGVWRLEFVGLHAPPALLTTNIWNLRLEDAPK